METKVVHCRQQAHDVYIGRPSKWGNPFSHLSTDTKATCLVTTREDAVHRYRDWILYGDGMYLLADIDEIRGYTLGCWCHPKACHGDVLAEIADLYYWTEDDILTSEF